MRRETTLNIVFHKIREQGEMLSKFDLPWLHVRDIVRQVRECALDHFNVTFDDGYEEHVRFAELLLEEFDVSVGLAVVTSDVGKEGFLRLEDLYRAQERGIEIMSHGVTHVALGKYVGNTVVATPTGGEYRDMPRGRAHVLTESEIGFQVRESANWFRERGFLVNSFVYPYGVYNETIRSVVARSGLYTTAYTCDNALESPAGDRFLIPRVVIENTRTPETWVEVCKKLF